MNDHHRVAGNQSAGTKLGLRSSLVPVISIQSFYIDIGYRLFKEFTSRAESFRPGSKIIRR